METVNLSFDSPALIIRLRNLQDQQAWEMVHPQLYRRIYAVTGKLTSAQGIDPENVACEVVREILTGLEQGKWPDLLNLTELLNLAARIARFRSLDAVRKKKEYGLPEGWENLLGSVREDHGKGEEVFKGLLEMLDPPPLRPVLFRDKFTEGLTYEELGARHGLSTGTVCSHFTRGLELLRTLHPETLRRLFR